MITMPLHGVRNCYIIWIDVLLNNKQIIRSIDNDNDGCVPKVFFYTASR